MKSLLTSATVALSMLLSSADAAQPTSNSLAGPAKPLQEAVRKANVDELAALLALGENPNAVDPLTRTALHYAAALGDDEAVRMLIEAGALVNVADKDGFTPLMRAAQNAHVGAARRLVEAGADSTLINAKDQTAGDLAAAIDADEIIEMLR